MGSLGKVNLLHSSDSVNLKEDGQLYPSCLKSPSKRLVGDSMPCSSGGGVVMEEVLFVKEDLGQRPQ